MIKFIKNYLYKKRIKARIEYLEDRIKVLSELPDYEDISDIPYSVMAEMNGYIEEIQHLDIILKELYDEGKMYSKG